MKVTNVYLKSFHTFATSNPTCGEFRELAAPARRIFREDSYGEPKMFIAQYSVNIHSIAATFSKPKLFPLV